MTHFQTTFICLLSILIFIPNVHGNNKEEQALHLSELKKGKLEGIFLVKFYTTYVKFTFIYFITSFALLLLIYVL